MDTKDTLMAYGEWLDSEQHLVKSDQGEGADTRTHEELVQKFISDWESTGIAVLAGR